MDDFVNIQVFVAVILGVSTVVFSIYLLLLCLLVGESRKKKFAISNLKRRIAALERRQDKIEADVEMQTQNPKDFKKYLEISHDYLQQLASSPCGAGKSLSQPPNSEQDAQRDTDRHSNQEQRHPQALPREPDFDHCYRAEQQDKKKAASPKACSTKYDYDYVDCFEECKITSSNTEVDYDYADCDGNPDPASGKANVPLPDSLSDCIEMLSREEKTGDISMSQNVAYKQVLKT